MISIRISTEEMKFDPCLMQCKDVLNEEKVKILMFVSHGKIICLIYLMKRINLLGLTVNINGGDEK